MHVTSKSIIYQKQDQLDQVKQSDQVSLLSLQTQFNRVFLRFAEEYYQGTQEILTTLRKINNST